SEEAKQVLDRATNAIEILLKPDLDPTTVEGQANTIQINLVFYEAVACTRVGGSTTSESQMAQLIYELGIQDRNENWFARLNVLWTATSYRRSVVMIFLGTIVAVSIA